MAWATARDRVKTIIEALSITHPTSSAATSVDAVYDGPPRSMQTAIAWVLFEPRVPEPDLVPGGLRSVIYELPTRLLVGGPATAVNSRIAGLFREAAITALDSEVALSGDATQLVGYSFSALYDETWGGKHYVGMDMDWQIRIDSLVTFTP